MNTNTQILFYNVTTNRTGLGCSFGIYFNYFFTSIFSFVFQYLNKLSPSSIRYTFSQMMILNHISNLKFFNYNYIVFFYKYFSNFMMKIPSLISNIFMSFSNKFFSFISSCRPFFTSTQSLLSLFQFNLRFSKIFRWINIQVITGYKKKFKTYINTNFLSSFWKNIIFNFYKKTNIIMTILFSYIKSFNFTFNG